MSQNNRFKSLVSNTLLFALGMFGSKLLGYIIYPFLTHYITKAQSGTFELVQDFCNLFSPIMYLSMNEAMIRFGMDSTVKKEDVYTTGISITFTGFGIFLLLYPLFLRLGQTFVSLHFIAEYLPYIYAYMLTSALRSLSSNYVRSQGHVKLFALDGLVTVLTNLAFNVIFIVVLQWNVVGYLLSVILSDFISVLILNLASRSYKDFQLRGLDLGTSRDMIRYSSYLMPAAIFWWVTTFSNRFIINYIFSTASGNSDAGLQATGLFSAANKLPSLLILISSVFIQAWQMSAFGETDTKEGEWFFSGIFRSYYALLFLVASGILILSKPYIGTLQKNYYEAWNYVPFLILASLFSCLVTFLGTIYNVHKENRMVTITTSIGALVNISLNLFLLPRIGLQGAAFATFFSYFLVFIIRSYDTRRYIKLNMRPRRIVVSLLLIFVQIFIYLTELPYNIPLQLVCTLGILLVNNAQIFELWDLAKGAIGSFVKGKKVKSE